jgi:O-antigen ligase
MLDRKNRLSTLADVLLFAFPILILCVSHGAGVFLGGVCLLALAGWREMGRAWRDHVSVLRPLAIAVLAFMAVCVASKIYHDTPWNVIDNPSRALLVVLTCWVIVRVAPKPERLWQGITVALFLALLIIAYQYFWLADSRPSAWVQPIAFANMVAALALVGFARPGDSRRDHAAAWFNVFCAVSILMMNGTRGAMIAMLVTLFPLLLVRYQRFSARMFLVATLAIGGLVAGSYLVPHSPVAKRVDQAFVEIHKFEQGNAESSVGARLKMWEIGLAYFEDHPWTGIGIGQFARVLRASPYCDGRTKPSMVCVLEHAHNDMVEAASTTGVPGLVTFLGLFLVPAGIAVSTLRRCRANQSDRGVSLACACLGVVMASLISGLTQVTMAHQANVVFYAGLIGLLLGLAGREAYATRTLPAKSAPATLPSAGARRMSASSV